MTNKYLARNSMSLVIRQIQNKTTKQNTIIYILGLIHLKDRRYETVVRLGSKENSYLLQVGVNIGLLLVNIGKRLVLLRKLECLHSKQYRNSTLEHTL